MANLYDLLDGKEVSGTPFWFMRQAGRYMPEYMAVRKEAGDFLTMCGNADLAAEVTMQPIKAFDMTAAIIFADILLAPMALGVDLWFEAGEGPKLGEFDIDKLQYDSSKVEPTFSAIEKVRAELSDDKDLIGFAGSPWTVATYMIEKGSSKNFANSKRMALSGDKQLDEIIDVLVDTTTEYLLEQHQRGANVLKLFDSWGGELQGDEFDKYITEPNKRIIEAVRAKAPGVKIIAFPRRAGLQKAQDFAKAAKPDCLAIDNYLDIELAAESFDIPIQGNLDPITLLAPQNVIEAKATRILEATRGKKFIFNLGHGIIPQTPPENVKFLSDLIRNYS